MVEAEKGGGEIPFVLMPMIYCMERDRLVCVVIAIAGSKLRVKKKLHKFNISILIIIDMLLF